MSASPELTKQTAVPEIQVKKRKIPVPRKLVKINIIDSDEKTSSKNESLSLVPVADVRVPVKADQPEEKFGAPNEFGVSFMIQSKCRGKCKGVQPTASKQELDNDTKYPEEMMGYDSKDCESSDDKSNDAMVELTEHKSSDSTVPQKLQICTCPDDEKEIKTISLRDHQIKSVKWMIERETYPISGVRGGANCASMGLGKTLMLLTLIMRDYKNPVSHPDYPAFPSLIICPLGNIRDPWLDQTTNFFGSSCPVLVFRKEYMGKAFDTITLEEIRKYKVVVTNYDTLKSVAKKYRLYEPLFERDDHNRRTQINPCSAPSTEMMGRSGDIMLFNTPWHRIALDESAEVISNPKTVAFYSIMCLYSLRKWILTGTPIRNKAKDLWSQFWFLGFRKIPSRQFTVTSFQRYQLDRCVWRMSVEEAGINLPELEINEVSIHLEERELECYNYWARATREAYQRWALGCLNFANVLTLFLRQRQCCVSPFTVTPESQRGFREDSEDYSEAQDRLNSMTSGLSKWIHDVQGTAGIQSAKVKRTLNIIQNEIPKTEKVLIFSNFKRVTDVIERAFQTYIPDEKYQMIDGDVTGADRDKAIDEFKRSDCRILMMTYKSGSVGLNLTVANNVIMMETVWTPSVLKQAAGRAHRVGQDKKVKVWQLIAEKTIERAMMMEIMANKQRQSDAFMKGEKCKGKTGQIDAKMLGKLLRY